MWYKESKFNFKSLPRQGTVPIPDLSRGLCSLPVLAPNIPCSLQKLSMSVSSSCWADSMLLSLRWPAHGWPSLILNQRQHVQGEQYIQFFFPFHFPKAGWASLQQDGAPGAVRAQDCSPEISPPSMLGDTITASPPLAAKQEPWCSPSSVKRTFRSTHLNGSRSAVSCLITLTFLTSMWDEIFFQK